MAEKNRDENDQIYVPEILKRFITIPLIPIHGYEKSSWIPNATILAEYVHILDEEFSRNYKFLRSIPGWHPLISRIYFALLFYIQILRCKEKANVITHKERSMLMHFFHMYPPDALEIPGILVPFYQAISTCKTPYDIDGLIYPTIPDVLGTKPASKIVIPDGLGCFLPNIPLLMTIINQFGNTLIASAGEVNMPEEWDPYEIIPLQQPIQIGLFGTPAQVFTELSQDQRWEFNGPFLSIPLETTQSINMRFKENYSGFGFPVIGPNYDSTSVKNFLCLNDNFIWFQRVFTIMTQYCSCFKDTVSLADIKSDGCNAGLITTTYEKTPIDTMPNRFGPHDTYQPPSTYHVKFAGRPNLINQRDSAISFMTLINTELPPNHPHYANSGKTENNHKKGPFWKFYPPTGNAKLNLNVGNEAARVRSNLNLIYKSAKN